MYEAVWWPNISSSACAIEIYEHRSAWAPSHAVIECGFLSRAACVYTDAVHSLLKIKPDLLAALTQATHVADYTLGCWVNVFFKLCKRCTSTESVLAIKPNTVSFDERTSHSTPMPSYYCWNTSIGAKHIHSALWNVTPRWWCVDASHSAQNVATLEP